MFRKNKVIKKHHGFFGSYEHGVWSGMINRCYCKTSGSYKNYGGRGIIVCDRWRESFLNFLEDMGKAPKNHEIDRIDNNGNYEPSNCKWSSYKENSRNRRNNRFIEYKGNTKTLSEWSEIYNIPRATLERRIFRMKWDVEKALTTSVMTKQEVSVIANNKRWSK